MRWVFDNLQLIGEAASSHLGLALPAIVASFLLALPLGWLANRFRWSRFALLTAASVLYAIPSLPLLIMLPLVLGTTVRDRLNVIVALTFYGLALMVRAAADALDAVPADAVFSATALGYSPARRFLQVELPLAGPALLAGLRVVTVSTVALTTVSAVLGIDNLGTLFTDGFQRGILEEVFAGIVVTMLLAITIDLALVLVGRGLMPWTRRAAS